LHELRWNQTAILQTGNSNANRRFEALRDAESDRYIRPVSFAGVKINEGMPKNRVIPSLETAARLTGRMNLSAWPG
jgi:hypothetical protein